MKKLCLAVCLAILLPLAVPAYTIVLKGGSRLEIQDKYRVVKDIVVVTLPNGNRQSMSLQKIDIAATEQANGQTTGDFLKNAVEPAKAADTAASQAAVDPADPKLAKKPMRRITNSDFEQYRNRRKPPTAGETVATVTAAPNAGVVVDPDSIASNPAKIGNNSYMVLNSTERDRINFQVRREIEKQRETYWRNRSRALLTRLRGEEEQIAALQAQIDNTRHLYQPPTPPVSVYSTGPTPRAGVVIGGVPIILGGTPANNGNVVVINQGNGQQRTLQQSLQDKLVDLQTQHRATIVEYEDMLEEARHEGALPGWLR
jgi:hypothetical protein